MGLPNNESVNYACMSGGGQGERNHMGVVG